MINEVLIACALKATLILIAAWLLTIAMRRASAAARHMVWVFALAALLLLPVFTVAIPQWTVTVPQSKIGPARPSQVRSPVSAECDWRILAWLAGATFVLARFGMGTLRIWVITRRARPMSIAGMSDRVALLAAERGAMPVAWHVLRPVILLPNEAAEWPPERLRAVLLHELAHVDRHDCWTLAMAELAV